MSRAQRVAAITKMQDFTMQLDKRVRCVQLPNVSVSVDRFRTLVVTMAAGRSEKTARHVQVVFENITPRLAS